MIISELLLWKDTGFTEDSVERPRIGSAMSSPDFSFTNVNPSKDRVFDELHLKGAYADLMACSYLKATYTMNNAEDLTVYGWIDAVSMKSDTNGFPMTVIDWHVDYWRTYASRARFGSGLVTRRPSGDAMPPQNYPYRFLKVDSSLELIPNSLDYQGKKLWWVYVPYTSEGNEGTTTSSEVYCFPCSFSTFVYISNDVDGLVEETPNLSGALAGRWDEFLGLTPSRIKGCFLSPIPPISYTGTGSFSDPIKLTDHCTSWGFYRYRPDEHTPYYASFVGGWSYQDVRGYQEFTRSLPKNTVTTDTETYVITGFDGETFGALPWGVSVRNYRYRMIVDSINAYIQIRFNGLSSHTEGTCFTIPCIAVEVTENSWSEYSYTGAREYDLQMRNMNADKALVQGLTGAVQGGSYGMLTETTGSDSRKWGMMPTKTSIGLAGAMGAFQAVGSALNYASEKLYFNGEEQKWEDYGHAYQTDGLLIQGGGWDTVLFGATICMKTVKPDGYSVTQRNTDISLYGAHVLEPREDCQSLVLAGGPMQIDNLVVKGPIPVEAKTMMRVLFAQGVRLI